MTGNEAGETGQKPEEKPINNGETPNLQTDTKPSNGGGRKPSIAARAGLISAMIIIAVAAAAGAGAGYYYTKLFSEDFPDISTLRKYNPSQATRVYDRNGLLISEFYVEKRLLVTLNQIPKLFRDATIAVEDAQFYEHSGINYEGILRAFFENIKAGRVVQGGSSITQQLAKTLLLTPERTMGRKIKEALLSLEIERSYSKNEILEIYLNQIYYGHGSYGVAAAAETYFGKKLSELTLAQIAMIAGLPKAPTNYSPYNNLEKARARRSHVLSRLVAVGAISEKDKEKAENEPIRLSGFKKAANKAAWFGEHVRRYLEKKYGATALYHSGLKIYTTLDLKMQTAADAALKAGLEELDKRLGYRGPVGKVNVEGGQKPDWAQINQKEEIRTTSPDFYRPGRRIRGVVTAVDKGLVRVTFDGAKGTIQLASMDWAHKANPNADFMWAPKIEDARKVLKKGDIIEVGILARAGADGQIPLALDQTPNTQASLLATNPKTGEILAMVGGYDADVSKFNRTVQAMRQPGSSFKPIIYTAALDNGFTPATVVMDSPVVIDPAKTGFKAWNPSNFEGEYFGPTTIREAVTHSRNVVTVKVIDKIGAQVVVDYARLFGITSPLDPYLSLALGSYPVTVEEMVRAYGVLANGGDFVDLMYINSVKDSKDSIMESNSPSPPDPRISPATAYVMASVMKSVVAEGTAAKVAELGRPIAGKTGTTNNYNDAWFIGFTPDIVCAVWVGRDDNSPIGKKETGARAAIPIWIAFMKEALKNYAVRDFTPPENVVFARVDKKTGLLTKSSSENAIFEAFIDGTQPTEYVHEIGQEQEEEQAP
ncbi:MAG: PBP1A family penicillin-binding protein [Nitrospinae bacterium]|nr:PBP1A family penicillin-binding protein [Nitrospinota bacterium]